MIVAYYCTDNENYGPDAKSGIIDQPGQKAAFDELFEGTIFIQSFATRDDAWIAKFKDEDQDSDDDGSDDAEEDDA